MIITECLLGRINTKTIDVVSLDQRLDPLGVARYNGGILSVNVRKWNLVVSEPAVLLAGVVAPLDGTVRVVLRLHGQLAERGRRPAHGLAASLKKYCE